jgi:hypothetical protein
MDDCDSVWKRLEQNVVAIIFNSSTLKEKIKVD